MVKGIGLGDDSNPSDENKIEMERRREKRIKKHFLLTYFDKNNPSKRFELTQLKNISLGGLCFVTSQPFTPSTKIGIELKTPYLADATYLEGVVLASHEKVRNLLYETRLKFEFLDPKAEVLLSKLIEYFVNEHEKDKSE